jgi:predicted nucleotidyltransferase
MSDTENKLSEYFKNQNNITMAFLFGSATTGRLISESDVDVAIWFDKNYTLDDINMIQGEIESLLHRNVDLIVLNQARPVIAWAAMRGKPLIIRNNWLYLKKMLEISTEAEDMQDFILDLFRLRQKLRKEFISDIR